jgi:hypothetical protein
MWFAVWIGRTSILDPKTPANKQTGCHGHAMQFLAVGQKFESVFSETQKNSEEFRQIQKNLDLIEET